MDCSLLVTGAELQPPATARAGADAAALTAALNLRKSWDMRNDAASAVLITSISDEELHTIHGIDEDPPQIWIRLREKFERRSEAEAESSFMLFLDFAHLESETADELIERYCKDCVVWEWWANQSIGTSIKFDFRQRPYQPIQVR